MPLFSDRFGIRGAIFLKRPDDSVAWRTESGDIEWTKEGALRRVDDRCLEVERRGERQHLRLFDHVTVRVSVGESHTHGLSLRLELIRAGERAEGGGKVESAKAEMIEVRPLDRQQA